MASTSPRSDAAMKERIITHMNKDHADSLALYLQHYSKLPVSAFGTSARLVEVTPEHMIIESHAGRNLIPFTPPMKTLGESRERLVAMHQASLAALDLSDVQVTRFVLPTAPWAWLVHAVVALCLVTLPFPRLLHPSSGSVVSRIWSVGGLVPGLAKLASAVGPPVWVGIILIHMTEAVVMARGRLRRHRVPPGTAVWWTWVIVTFNGGLASFVPFDDHVRSLAEKRKKDEKH